MADDRGRKRQRSAFGCAHEGNDPLVEDLEALKQRVRESSHLVSNYGRAIASIRAHPEPLRSAAEAKKLRNIGNYLANQIHSILRKRGLLQQDEEPSIAPPPTSVARVEAPQSTGNSNGQDRTRREYAPAYQKQPWFVLLALQEAQAVDEDAAMASAALLKRIQDAGYEGSSGKLRACLASLTGTHEVVKRSNLGHYFLTEKGRRSAELCPGSLANGTEKPGNPSRLIVENNRPTGTSAATRPSATTLDVVCIDLPDSDDEAVDSQVLEPEPEMTTNRMAAIPEDLVRETDTWELVLLLDHREVIERRNPRILERKLLERNVTCEVRALGVGDVQWLARRQRIGGETQEFILNVIVERKEVNDLSGSIIDRRYFEQKTRLSTVSETCGHVHVIYLVEGSLTQITTVRTSGLHTAMGRTQVQSNFFVQLCQNADETVAFLARVHARLLAKFPPNPRATRPQSSHLLPSTCADAGEFTQLFCVPPQTFSTFNALFRKKTQFTVREIYQKMLMQAPGLSAAKTVGLSTKYHNFTELRSALQQHGRDSEVEHVRCGKNQRRLGLKARESLGELLTASEYIEDS
ncbi:Crossover junction endonuclease mus81 [Phytophthora boehmeriae]|uniref:Crossover junction endonuclease MUS81 n=1 Tax=Phytophthora boehmeriae TaxID=109152 RepID=A0A8T1X6L4_9STRA|nr:Crossover junction endonuclease mus81 [Phytophthora boehmeriae]